MTINVTQTDIARGCPLSRTECPVARAIKRKVNTENVRVQLSYIHIGRRKYTTPKRIAVWVKAYDRGAEVRPVRFEL